MFDASRAARRGRELARRTMCSVAFVAAPAVAAPTLSSGCGGDDAADAAIEAASCVELGATCLGRQQVCAEDARGAWCAACAAGTYATGDGQCEPLAGTPITHEFAEFTTQPGEEIKGLCQSWTLGNDEELWVSAVEMHQNEASHHSIWTYVPDDVYAGPDGWWPCTERDYAYLTAAVRGGNLYNQSTQAPQEVQRFPNGAAIRIPPRSRIIGDIHLLNTTPQPVSGRLSLTLHTVPASEVTVKLAPFELEFEQVLVPARSRSRLEATCDLGAKFAEVGLPSNLAIYYMLPHAHERGRRLFVDVLGGDRDGMRFLDDRQYTTYEARGVAYDEPFVARDVDKLRFGCEYENTTTDTFEWGYNAEMCQFAGFMASPITFTMKVNGLSDPRDDAGVAVRDGLRCDVVTAPWEQDKPGGPTSGQTP